MPAVIDFRELRQSVQQARNVDGRFEEPSEDWFDDRRLDSVLLAQHFRPPHVSHVALEAAEVAVLSGTGRERVRHVGATREALERVILELFVVRPRLFRLDLPDVPTARQRGQHVASHLDFGEVGWRCCWVNRWRIALEVQGKVRGGLGREQRRHLLTSHHWQQRQRRSRSRKPSHLPRPLGSEQVQHFTRRIPLATERRNRIDSARMPVEDVILDLVRSLIEADAVIDERIRQN